jgi:hypothetical protein
MKSCVLAVLLSAILISCGGGSSSNTLNVSGTWQLSIQSQTFNTAVTGTVVIQQSGTTLSGTAGLAGSPCAGTAALKGSVSGSTMTFTLTEGSQAVSFQGNVSGTTATGTYAAPTGGCTAGDTGTWSATKQ